MSLLTTGASQLRKITNISTILEKSPARAPGAGRQVSILGSFIEYGIRTKPYLYVPRTVHGHVMPTVPYAMSIRKKSAV